MTTDQEMRWCVVIRKRMRRGAPLTRKMRNLYDYSPFGNAASWAPGQKRPAA